MAAGGIKRLAPEWAARVLVLGLALGLPLGLLAARWVGTAGDSRVEIHARVAETGGFSPANLSATVGQPLALRLVSDDVQHGFALGQSEAPALDLAPGQPVETTLLFDQPGKYVYYCTRWCGLGHWRMRGTIEVSPAEGAPAGTAEPVPVPLYVSLGLDLDAPHPAPAEALPQRQPSAAAGAASGVTLPSVFLDQQAMRAQSPAAVWQALRAQPANAALDDAAVWDLVAWVWQQQATSASLAEGRALYAQNCAACHGEAGGGDGVMAPALAQGAHSAEMAFGAHTVAPANFTNPALMLGASPAILQGKILRGGMGTGMPYWGPIVTEAQTWSLVDYLWTFQFRYSEAP